MRHNTLSRTVVSDSCKAIMPVTLLRLPLRGRSCAGSALRGALGRAKLARIRTGPTEGTKGAQATRAPASLLRGRSLPGGSQRGAGCGGPVGSKGLKIKEIAKAPQGASR